MPARELRSATKYIIIHHSATAASKNIGAKEIDAQHRGRGFNEIGYHLIIRRDGTLEQGRPLNCVGAHAKGYNFVSVGICLIGGRSESAAYAPEFNFTKQQWRTLKATLLKLNKEYPKAIVIGHNQISSKDCPGFNVYEVLKNLLFNNVAPPFLSADLP